MILNKHGHKRTANQLAKELVFEYGYARAFDWGDFFEDAYIDRFTKRELALTAVAIQKQIARVSKLLGHPDPKKEYSDEEA